MLKCNIVLIILKRENISDVYINVDEKYPCICINERKYL
jgi:hypothetical protein